MKQTQATWTSLIASELKKQIERPEEVPGGLVEYVMALANDQVKSADFTEALLARLEPLVSEKYRVPISENLNEAMDGYLDVAKGAVKMLIDVAFNDVKPAVKVHLHLLSSEYAALSSHRFSSPIPGTLTTRWCRSSRPFATT